MNEEHTSDERTVDPYDVGTFPCGQCGAKLQFAPGTTSLECQYCGHLNEIAEADVAIDELDFHAQLAQLRESADVEQLTTVKCQTCSAETDRPPELDSFECVFCGSDIVATESSTRLIKPKSLLPFHVDKKAAVEKFRQWISSRWFAPSDLKRFAREGKLDGVYVPYWTYDSDTRTHYTGQRGEHYWVTETYTTTENGKTVTRTRQVQRTRWYPASGTVFNTFDDVLVLGSRSLPKKYADKLEPWDLGALTSFKQEFLAGFRAERYQVELDDGFQEAAEIMDGHIRNTIRADIGGDVQQIHTVDTNYLKITFKHILLPIWISAYRYRQKVFRILVNARTGEVQGERPWSFWKIALLVLVILAVVGAIAIVAGIAGGS